MSEQSLENSTLESETILNHPTPDEDNGSEGNKENDMDDVSEKGNEDMADLDNESANPEMKQTPSKNEWADILGNGELKMKVIRKGKRNTRPQPTDVCDIKIVGKLEDGKVVEKSDLMRVQIGDHEVVQGLEFALSLMNVGEKALIIVSPRFAYGSMGNPPDIPPDATLKYMVELIMADMETPLENIPHDERMTLATAKRERGNWWYARQDGTKAVQCYKKAIDLLDETIPYVNPEGETIVNSDENIEIVVDEKMKVYNNLAAAQLMMEAYDSALASITEVLKHEPRNVKALFRKGKILASKGCVCEAVAPLRLASLVEPTNTAIASELYKCVRLAEIQRRDEKILYRKMFGQSKIRGKLPSKQAPKAKKSCWARLWGTAATATVMVAVFIAIGYKFKNYPFM